MSAEHGGHGEDISFTGIIRSIILAILGIGTFLEAAEKMIQDVVNPQDHGH